MLRLFSPERTELSVTEVARLLGMPKSSVSRLLRAMLADNLLANVEGTPRYRIGHLFFEVARMYERSTTLMDVTNTALAAMCEQTRHGGYISILDGADVLPLRVFFGTETLRVVTPLGKRMSAFATATGRNLLARLSDSAVRALHPDPLVPPSATAPQDMDDLLRRLEQVRRCGWCDAIDEGVSGVGSVAVAVSDPSNSETLAFCLSFPAHLVSELERHRLAGMLTDAARRIATRFNDTFWTTLPRVAAA
ncbi:MAG: IclR family transcriptional regulator [Alphaproteobacteria bacterium]|nr:IclR family transcriptional regulator [Alphaproteobacteria bacterium]